VRSNDRLGRRATSIAVVVMVGASLAVGQVRPWLAARYHELRQVDDVYALPTPEQTVGLSLGYRAALADLIFANTLVAYGIRSQEKRRFEFAANYLETCVALDPKLREVYYFADTILTFQTVPVPYRDVVAARRIQERGLKEFPYDTELWLVTGQFLAYLAPGQIKEPAVRKEWQEAGARIMARACELAAGDEITTRKCMVARGVLTKAGYREAVIRMLKRVIAFSTDEQLRRRAQMWLKQKLDEPVPAALEARQARLTHLQQSNLPFVSHELFMVLGPPFEAAACAGRFDDTNCATSWRAWMEAGDQGASDAAP